MKVSRASKNQQSTSASSLKDILKPNNMNNMFTTLENKNFNSD